MEGNQTFERVRLHMCFYCTIIEAKHAEVSKLYSHVYKTFVSVKSDKKLNTKIL